jgi:hypothetical protein
VKASESGKQTPLTGEDLGPENLARVRFAGSRGWILHPTKLNLATETFFVDGATGMLLLFLGNSYSGFRGF